MSRIKKFSTPIFRFWLLFLGRFPILTPCYPNFHPPWASEKGTKINFIKNWYHHRISRIKNFSMPIFRFWLLFLGHLPFLAPFDPNCWSPWPRKRFKNKILSKTDITIKFLVSKNFYAVFRFWLLFLGRFAYFDPFLTPSLTPVTPTKG